MGIYLATVRGVLRAAERGKGGEGKGKEKKGMLRRTYVDCAAVCQSSSLLGLGLLPPFPPLCRPGDPHCPALTFVHSCVDAVVVTMKEGAAGTVEELRK